MYLITTSNYVFQIYLLYYIDSVIAFVCFITNDGCQAVLWSDYI